MITCSKHKWKYTLLYCLPMSGIEPGFKLFVQRHCTKCYDFETGKRLTEDDITKCLGLRKLKELFQLDKEDDSK